MPATFATSKCASLIVPIRKRILAVVSEGYSSYFQFCNDVSPIKRKNLRGCQFRGPSYQFPASGMPNCSRPHPL